MIYIGKCVDNFGCKPLNINKIFIDVWNNYRYFFSGNHNIVLKILVLYISMMIIYCLLCVLYYALKKCCVKAFTRNNIEYSMVNNDSSTNVSEISEFSDTI